MRPLAYLNDSKQCSEERREELFQAVLCCAEKVAVRVIPPGDIDRFGLHKSNLAGLRAMLHALVAACGGMPRRRLPARADGAGAQAVVDGDEKSAAIAAASIVAKVTRDRLMRRLAALYPAYGFAQHVGYITPGHSAVVREHRAVGRAPAVVPGAVLPGRGARPGVAAERRAARLYRLRGWTILGANVWAGGNELDLIARRGRSSASSR